MPRNIVQSDPRLQIFRPGQSFTQQMQTDPALQAALIQFGGGLTQPIPVGGNELSQIGASLQGAVNTVLQARAGQAQRAQEEREFGLKEREVAAREQQVRGSQEQQKATLEEQQRHSKELEGIQKERNRIAKLKARMEALTTAEKQGIEQEKLKLMAERIDAQDRYWTALVEAKKSSPSSAAAAKLQTMQQLTQSLRQRNPQLSEGEAFLQAYQMVNPKGSRQDFVKAFVLDASQNIMREDRSPETIIREAEAFADRMEQMGLFRGPAAPIPGAPAVRPEDLMESDPFADLLPSN